MDIAASTASEVEIVYGDEAAVVESTLETGSDRDWIRLSFSETPDLPVTVLLLQENFSGVEAVLRDANGVALETDALFDENGLLPRPDADLHQVRFQASSLTPQAGDAYWIDIGFGNTALEFADYTLIVTPELPGDDTSPFRLAPGESLLNSFSTLIFDEDSYDGLTSLGSYTSDRDLLTLDLPEAGFYRLVVDGYDTHNPLQSPISIVSGVAQIGASQFTSGARDTGETIFHVADLAEPVRIQVGGQFDSEFLYTNSFYPHYIGLEPVAASTGTSEGEAYQGRTRDDMYDAGPGDDSMTGRAGNDTLAAGLGDDTVRAGLGEDDVLGGPGADLIFGMLGNDALAGGSGADTLFGNAGDDTLASGTGGDVLNGGLGDDALYGVPGWQEAWLADVGDLLQGGAGDDTLAGGRWP